MGSSERGPLSRSYRNGPAHDVIGMPRQCHTPEFPTCSMLVQLTHVTLLAQCVGHSTACHAMLSTCEIMDIQAAACTGFEWPCMKSYDFSLDDHTCSCKTSTMHEDINLCTVSAIEVQSVAVRTWALHHSHEYFITMPTAQQE